MFFQPTLFCTVVCWGSGSKKGDEQASSRKQAFFIGEGWNHLEVVERRMMSKLLDNIMNSTPNTLCDMLVEIRSMFRSRLIQTWCNREHYHHQPCVEAPLTFSELDPDLSFSWSYHKKCKIYHPEHHSNHLAIS